MPGAGCCARRGKHMECAITSCAGACVCVLIRVKGRGYGGGGLGSRRLHPNCRDETTVLGASVRGSSPGCDAT